MFNTNRVFAFLSRQQNMYFWPITSGPEKAKCGSVWCSKNMAIITGLVDTFRFLEIFFVETESCAVERMRGRHFRHGLGDDLGPADKNADRLPRVVDTILCE